MELLALLVMPSLMLSEIAHPMWLILICWLLWGIHLLESTAKRFKCPLDSQLIWIFPLFSKLHYYIYPCSNSIKSIKIYLTKGDFFLHCQNKYSKSPFWTWNLNFPPIKVNDLFKFQDQDSDLENFVWQCEKHIALSEKKGENKFLKSDELAFLPMKRWKNPNWKVGYSPKSIF